MKLLSIAGARPNFMKLASISHAINRHNMVSINKIDHIIVHTGQHYDEKMSKLFFDELEIPTPDVNLEVGSGSHAFQTAEIIKRFEPVLLRELPDVLLVVGDVNSTIACTLVASKIQYPLKHSRIRPIIVHVEAGLRSLDRTMPEEINRILTDAISDMLFVTEEKAITNLKCEGISPEKIHFVGNVMIDTLMCHLVKAENSKIKDRLNTNGPYGLITLHRPSNVDSRDKLELLVNCFINISEKLQLLFPIHPRTRKSLQSYNLLNLIEKKRNITLCEPIGYLDFLNLIKDATMVLTDSGGIQEETTFMGVPCITLRDNTERPVTVDIGTNHLVGTDVVKIIETVDSILDHKGKQSEIPELWDGQAGERIISKIIETIK